MFYRKLFCVTYSENCVFLFLVFFFYVVVSCRVASCFFFFVHSLKRMQLLFRLCLPQIQQIIDRIFQIFTIILCRLILFIVFPPQIKKKSFLFIFPYSSVVFSCVIHIFLCVFSCFIFLHLYLLYKNSWNVESF